MTKPLGAYIAIGLHCWGRGATEAESLKNLEDKSRGWIVYEVGPGTTVSGMDGSLIYPSAGPAPRMVARRKGARGKVERF